MVWFKDHWEEDGCRNTKTEESLQIFLMTLVYGNKNQGDFFFVVLDSQNYYSYFCTTLHKY